MIYIFIKRYYDRMFENILYATDFSESPLMLPCMGIIGKTNKIHLLHVIGEDTQIDPKLFESNMQEAKAFLEERLNVERGGNVAVDVHVMPGVPARDICNVAHKVDATLVAINYHMPEGAMASTTQKLIMDCDRPLLVMTRFASDIIERSDKAMEQYCTNIFSTVLCPMLRDSPPKVEALRSLKGEVSIGEVIFLFMGGEKPESAMSGARKAGIRAEGFALEGDPETVVIGAAEKVDASLILLDGRTELDLALQVARESLAPLLILK
jgi:nucleotide-binding universal stress UspA family protein